MGGAKQAVTESVIYANERLQFGRAISKYGAIRYKLAEQTIKTFVNESAMFTPIVREGGLRQNTLKI